MYREGKRRQAGISSARHPASFVCSSWAGCPAAGIQAMARCPAEKTCVLFAAALLFVLLLCVVFVRWLSFAATGDRCRALGVACGGVGAFGGWRVVVPFSGLLSCFAKATSGDDPGSHYKGGSVTLH